jgi:hypothetical protein
MNIFFGVDPNNPTPARDTRAAIDASGNWLAVWDSFPDSATDPAIVSRSPDSEFPKGVTGVSTGKSAPQVAMDGVGNAIIVWSDQSGVEVRSRSADGTWDRTRSLATGDLHDPVLAVDANATDTGGNAAAGNAIVGWLRNNDIGGSPHLEARIRPAGGTFGRTKILSPSGDVVQPQVAIAGASVVAAWTNRSVSTNIQAVTDSVTGRFKRVQNLSPDGEESDFPAAAVDPAGEAIVVWKNNIRTAIQGAISPTSP